MTFSRWWHLSFLLCYATGLVLSVKHGIVPGIVCFGTLVAFKAYRLWSAR